MAKDPFYFAYGSNLNLSDMKEWCADNNIEFPLKEKVANAYLPDMRLTLNYNSTERGGGVLNIRQQMGQVVPGVLFRVAPGGWSALDKRELAPRIHRELNVLALTDDGRAHPALTFLVAAPLTESVFVPPSKEYVKIVEGAIEYHNLNGRAFRALVEGKDQPWIIDNLFVYGTFMEGESRHHILKSWGIPAPGRAAQSEGMLFDSGKGYPCMTPSAGSIVHGELYTLPDPRKAFEMLDIVEDFRGYGDAGSNFRRSVIKVRDVQKFFIAWCYIYAKPSEGLAPIPSGSWRKR